ncbi:MAG: endonuclease [Candidatus Cloacimonas sp. 4484_140]|nr:MAG: endonuclease [Candidatus Cloacimonas sp. 4484_140]
MNFSRELIEIYDLLYDRHGPQHWWPGETRDEIIIGAILTQNTNWKNVEKAIENLKHKNLLTLTALRNAEIKEIAQCIRPSGYYNQKTTRLQEIAKFFHRNSLQCFGAHSIANMRKELITLKGIGPETADSILLYAFEKPVFIIDAYTTRIFQRLGFLPGGISYEEAQKFFMQNLENNTKLFNEFHALLVRHAKEYCQKNPHCAKCVLLNKCKFENKNHDLNKKQ